MSIDGQEYRVYKEMGHTVAWSERSNGSDSSDDVLHKRSARRSHILRKSSIRRLQV